MPVPRGAAFRVANVKGARAATFRAASSASSTAAFRRLPRNYLRPAGTAPPLMEEQRLPRRRTSLATEGHVKCGWL